MRKLISITALLALTACNSQAAEIRGYYENNDGSRMEFVNGQDMNFDYYAAFHSATYKFNSPSEISILRVFKPIVCGFEGINDKSFKLTGCRINYLNGVYRYIRPKL